MTLVEAVNILNLRRHRGISVWELEQLTGAPDSVVVSGPDRHSDLLTPFEAVAVAEKYQSETTPNLGWDALEARTTR